MTMIQALHDTHLSYLIAQRCMSSTDQGICIILDNNNKMTQTLNELKTFLPTALHRRLFVLPDWETLPYDHINAHKEIINRRIQTLYGISQTPAPILLMSALSYSMRLPPKSFIIRESFVCAVGQTMSVEGFRSLMLAKGYDEVKEVSDVGQFAIRGSILDMILSDHTQTGYRIELFDDEVDSIRLLDVANHRSHTPLESIDILPNREYLYTHDASKICQQREALCPEYLRDDLRKKLKNLTLLSGIDYYLPFLHAALDSIHDYLPANTLYIAQNKIDEITKEIHAYMHERYQAQIQMNRPVAHPDSLCHQTTASLLPHLCFYVIDQPSMVSSAVLLPALNDDEHTFDQNVALHELFSNTPSMRIYAPNAARAENLYHCLKSDSLPFTLVSDDPSSLFDQRDSDSAIITTGRLRTGFICLQTHTAYISENDFLGRIIDYDESMHASKSSFNAEQVENWQVGTLIVHRDYGIGRFQALTTLTRDGQPSDFLVLEYANEDKLYVATNQFHLLSRYIGPQSKKIHLTSLAGKKWHIKRQKAIENADLFADKLLSQHAVRAASVASSLQVSEHDLAQFCEYFPYTETPDQKKAIDVILGDISKTKAMNRLLCGDVGFGKTEVAMRAAFVCAFSGHQVAILAPTTLLVKQHLETFKQRFDHFPIRLAMLSRLASQAQQTKLKDQLRNGEIDIVIATHGLLQPDIRFKSLGLLVIDEEHKFGVKQKELIQSISSSAHTLAMSATPIPRTLHMTLAKLRDISIIATPPKNRLSIQTFVYEYQEPILKEALLREHQRGGQSYVIHNDIQTLSLIQENINRLLPSIRCRIMHAKQKKTILEQTMLSFQQGHFDVLLATTIVESGIDIPNANTIIIQRADLLGLSQIHQLRGRVGRSHHQAYAYLLTAPQSQMTEEGLARMRTVAKQKALGSGLNVALEDLEIRGAGDLLGKKQSGTAEEVGLSLYNEMLEKATRKRMGLADQASSALIDIDMGVVALIPDSYIKDYASRLSYYRAISCAETDGALEEVRNALQDRFGMLPEPLVNLFSLRKTQQLALALGIHKIVARPHYHDVWPVNHASMKQLLQQTKISSERIKIIDGKIRLMLDTPLAMPLRYLAHIDE